MAKSMSLSTRLFYDVFQTAAGWMGILASEEGLKEIILPQNKPEVVLRLMGGNLDLLQSDPERFRGVSQRLQAYFSGQDVPFPDPLDLSGTTTFQKKVWEAARRIPYGQTRSYREIALKIGQPGAARAVGQALGKNPLPVIIPCHRVVASNGGPGGFSGGLAMKKKMLALEKL